MSRKLDSIEQQKTNHRLSSSFVKFYEISKHDLKGLKKAQNDLKVFYSIKILPFLVSDLDICVPFCLFSFLFTQLCSISLILEIEHIISLIVENESQSGGMG